MPQQLRRSRRLAAAQRRREEPSGIQSKSIAKPVNIRITKLKLTKASATRAHLAPTSSVATVHPSSKNGNTTLKKLDTPFYKKRYDGISHPVLYRVGSQEPISCSLDTDSLENDGDDYEFPTDHDEVGDYYEPPTDHDEIGDYCEPPTDHDDIEAAMDGVHNPNYRHTSLASNGIHIRHPKDPLPDLVVAHYQQMTQSRSTGLLAADQVAEGIRILDYLGHGCAETQIADCLCTYIFPKPEAVASCGPVTGLARTVGMGVGRHLIVPQSLPLPKPDTLYGYPMALSPFTDAQHLILRDLHPDIEHYPLSGSILFPFLVVEFKAATGTGGDLWVGTNQCAGASYACLRAVEQLNVVLAQHGCTGHMINLCHSVVVDNNLAQLYVSWLNDSDGKTYMQRVESFLLSLPEHFVALRSRILNILDWGRKGRLNGIRSALNFIEYAKRKAGTGVVAVD